MAGFLESEREWFLKRKKKLRTKIYPFLTTFFFKKVAKNKRSYYNLIYLFNNQNSV